MPTVVRVARKKPPVLPAAYPPLPVRRFTVDEYHQLIQTGILKSGERVELIHGWIVPKMPTNPTHASIVRRLDRLLQRLVGDGAVVGVQQPITTLDSEPEPDLTVSRGPEVRYFMSHPTADDIHFVIEVSDTTLAFDQGEKLALYARAGVLMYWIVNVEARGVEVHTQPRGGRRPTYRTRTGYGPRDAVPVVIAGKRVGSIPVSDLLP
jgi:Uma2 family endonuclease